MEHITPDGSYSTSQYHLGECSTPGKCMYTYWTVNVNWIGMQTYINAITNHNQQKSNRLIKHYNLSDN